MWPRIHIWTELFFPPGLKQKAFSTPKKKKKKNLFCLCPFPRPSTLSLFHTKHQILVRTTVSSKEETQQAEFLEEQMFGYASICGLILASLLYIKYKKVIGRNRNFGILNNMIWFLCVFKKKKSSKSLSYLLKKKLERQTCITITQERESLPHPIIC